MSVTRPQSEDDCSTDQQPQTTSCISNDNAEHTASSYENGAVEAEKQPREGTAASSKKIPPCRFFKKNNQCNFGNSCKFSHDIVGKTPREESACEGGDETPQDAAHQDQPPSSSQEKSPSSVEQLSSSREQTSGDRAEQKVCRFYSQSGWCRNGKRCRFLHEKMKGETSKDKVTTESQEAHAENPQDAGKEPRSKLKEDNKKEKPVKKICRYFKAGHCKMGDRCKFLHPTEGAIPAKSNEPRLPATRPTMIDNEPVKSMKIADLTPENLEKLRGTEITQLMKRFTGDQIAVMETEGDKDIYRVTINPTDPDWPFDIKEFEFEVKFPSTYPLDPFSVTMPEDQVLPIAVLQSMIESISEWILAKHGTNQIAGKVELMFRPFLRWLDRSLERLFTEAAKQFKKVVDAKTAGFEFVAYSKMKTEDEPEEIKWEFDVQVPAGAIVGPEGVILTQVTATTPDQDLAREPQLADTASVTRPSGEAPKKIDLSNVQRRGTEVKLNGLQLSEGVSTMVAQVLGVIIQCSRCRNKCDIITPPRRVNAARCGKCQHQQLVTYRPSMVHHFGATLGYLDLEGCTTFDLIMPDCVFVIGCLQCSEEAKVQELQFGQVKTIWCEKCHAKMTIQVDTAKFLQLQASQPLPSEKAHVIHVKQLKNQSYPEIHEGHPLPEYGTCKHFKKSFRWLRFPCCGKCYPCDECHRLQETDHEMKYANRMICGFCCKEQQYSPDKPCISCDSLTTKSRTSHWEGGAGCRNKTKMSKTDKQKYSNASKTVSRKQQNLMENKRAKPVEK